MFIFRGRPVCPERRFTSTESEETVSRLRLSGESYLTSLTRQAAGLRKQGVSADDAAKRVDLASHAKDFPQIQGPGADLRGVRRLYAWLDEGGR